MYNVWITWLHAAITIKDCKVATPKEILTVLCTRKYVNYKTLYLCLEQEGFYSNDKKKKKKIKRENGISGN